MNSLPTIARISILAGCCCIAQTTAQAASIAAGEQILNGGFQTGTGTASLANWTTSNANAGLASDAINKSGGTAGFNSFFTSAFAILGNASGPIPSGPDIGIFSIFQTFTLADTLLRSAVIETYDLTINFSTVFNGQDNLKSASAYNDLFFATLSANDDSIPQYLLFSQTSLAISNNQLPFSATIFGLSPGAYTLKFVLNEKSGTGNNLTNTAAGIDNVSVTAFGNPMPELATAAIAAVPEPSTLLLLGIGLAGSASFRLGKKRLS